MITDGTAAQDGEGWFRNLRERMAHGVDFVQIREPELTARELAEIARRVCAAAGEARVLVNDRADIAIACGAHGVHLRDASVAAERIRSITGKPLTISVACHDVEGVRAAARRGADYILLAPIFSPLSKSSIRPALGIDSLREAAGSVPVPVIALGGITAENAAACVEAGAAGVAGISLFNAPLRSRLATTRGILFN